MFLSRNADSNCCGRVRVFRKAVSTRFAITHSAEAGAKPERSTNRFTSNDSLLSKQAAPRWFRARGTSLLVGDLLIQFVPISLTHSFQRTSVRRCSETFASRHRIIVSPFIFNPERRGCFDARCFFDPRPPRRIALYPNRVGLIRRSGNQLAHRARIPLRFSSLALGFETANGSSSRLWKYERLM